MRAASSSRGHLLIRGTCYDRTTVLEGFIGWTEGDGSGHEGYSVFDYFTDSGMYLGPDLHGIEPIYADEESCDCMDCSINGEATH